MQTVIIPWKARSKGDEDAVFGWLRGQAAVIRSAYANACNDQGKFLSEKELKTLLAERFPDHPLGSWAIHCAAREGLKLRRQTPEGRRVFGGRDRLERRRKGLITNAEWQRRRHMRSMEIIGDRTRWGNRHFRLSENGRQCAVEFLGKKIVVDLGEMVGKQGALVLAVAKLAAACEISITFDIGPAHLCVKFNEMDLRKLPPGMTLEEVKIAEQGTTRKGRKRKDPDTHYAAHRVKPVVDRPVHPEWRDPQKIVATRAIGLDLNPEWVGISVIEVNGDPQDADNVHILDHRLHRIAVPLAADAANMTRIMANVAAKTINLARAWNVGLIIHEDGLGKLSWSKKSAKQTNAVQTVNYWSRNALLGGLARRCKLAGIKFQSIWGGYSTTIGNLLFDLPDACASAAEIARRGYAAASGIKDRLPAVPPRVHLRRWKDGYLPEATAKAVAEATCWQTVHRAIKSAQAGSCRRSGIGYRRLHPSASLMEPGSFEHLGRSYAVDRLGTGKGVSCSARPVLFRTVRNSSNQALNG